MGKDEAVTPAVAGQPPEQPQGAATGATQPQYVTLEQAQQIAQQAAEEAFRRAQGLVSKADNRITKRVQADLEALRQMLELQRSLGVEIDPTTESAMRQRVLEKAFSEAEDPQEPQQSPAVPNAPDTGEDDDGDVDPVTAEAWAMMEQAGTVIEDDDPEAAMIDSSSPYKFLKSVEAAIQAKQTRLASKTPTNLGAVGQFNPNPIANINDPDKLLRMGFEKLGL